jgi:flagellar biosynthesis/type III secretory pathway chaperone
MSLDIPATGARLEELLSRIRDMWLLLQREEEVLSARDAALLDQVTATKEQLARTINQLSLALSDELKRLGLPAMPACLDLLPSSDPGRACLAATWQEIAALAAECERLNEANGAYITLLRQHVQRCLDVLHERPAHNLTYGPDGVGQRPATSRRLLSV